MCNFLTRTWNPIDFEIFFVLRQKVLYHKFIIIIIGLGEKKPCTQLLKMPYLIKSKMLRKKNVVICNSKMSSIVNSILISEMLKYEEILVLELMKYRDLCGLFYMQGVKHQIMHKYKR